MRRSSEQTFISRLSIPKHKVDPKNFKTERKKLGSFAKKPDVINKSFNSLKVRENQWDKPMSNESEKGLSFVSQGLRNR